MDFPKKIAQALLKINAVGFSVKDPITFTSGLQSPVYVDNRRFLFWPEEWHLVIEGFIQKIEEKNIEFDVIAGIETAGIPHSSALAFTLKKPSIFVRKKPKEHATGKKIEGGDVAGKKVLLVEDLVTTGGSSLAGVEALREAGALVDTCLVIVNYGFPKAQKAFQDAGVQLHELTSFPVILQEALQLKRVTQEEVIVVQGWLDNPKKYDSLTKI